ncbi:uncharacterized protein LOC124646011 [Helicoverpa zea]|uniref:uncharacterized protein LOC124646011 n=1 Tax=Helicoverpa zea TaxID=7113 RepID=UPI001F5A2C75|nr:uncharacterized protein LOC124646011 [Helicoverpa zea]
MSENKRYKELVTKRASAKGQITKFKNYLSNISKETELNDIQLTELRLKLAKFEALSVRVDDLQSEIDVLNPENIAAEIDERDRMEQDIVINIATAKNLLDILSSKKESDNRRSSVHNASCCNDEHHRNVEFKLPQIQITKFNGEYFRWLEFRDTFESLIHNNERIPEINKFHYLNSYLQGDAARIVSNFEVSAKNYGEAWKLLCSRYNNNRILINHHLSSLVHLKQLPRESEKSLRYLVDHITKNLRALASLGQSTDNWDVLVIYMVSGKLDNQTLLKWEEYRSTMVNDSPTLEQFFKFITDRANVLESTSRNNNHSDNVGVPRVPSNLQRSTTNNNNQIHHFHKYNQRHNSNSVVKSFATTSHNKNKAQPGFSCIICDQRHRIYDCPTFKAKSIDERMNDVLKYKLCTNCLRQGHSVNDCRLRSCQEPGCTEKHNSLLHRPPVLVGQLVSVEEQGEVVSAYCNKNTNQIILSTAVVEALNPLDGQKIKVRALLDCGSQSSFITESLKVRLALKSFPIDTLKVIGIGNTPNNKVNESCNIKLQSINSSFNISCSCLVLKELTGRLPKFPIDISLLQLPDNISLADPMFYKPACIDILIGADLFWDILGNEQISLGINNPKLRSSQLGWIVSGPIQAVTPDKRVHCNHSVIYKDNDSVDKLLTKFWELEEIPAKPIINENECERHFLAHTTRTNTGRFCVKLPLKDSADCLGDTYKLAKKRFLNLEKRLGRNPTLKSEYANFLKEYADLGHLSVVDVNCALTSSYYLCHHAVLKQESETTKLRVVFDGSAPSSSGYSLNDILMVGPNVQDNLFSILIRSRQYKYLLTGDVEKMFRQVLLHEDDRHLQRILWRETESEPIKTLELNTVTYGTASASYLSTRCLWQIGQQQDDVRIKDIIQRDFYVDDLITGSDDAQELVYIHRSVTQALQSACFHLRKFKTNNSSIFNNVIVNEQDKLLFSESISTLGLGWTPSSDVLHFPIKGFSSDDSQTITKRLIMSNAFKIFDPLGILSPVVVKPKIMLQNLWQLKLDWDQPVPDAIKNDWNKFSESIKYLSNLQVPRLVLGESPQCIELHSFSDASKHAYGACIYMRCINMNGDVTVRLLCAKSKVAPLKPTTIPRLELCAALLAAKLTRAVLDSLRRKPAKLVHWCDSSVVLCWMRCDASKLKVYVANRVTEIRELTSSSAWRYVPTQSNPADLISRGVDAKPFTSMALWWTGPSFLLLNESEWPKLNANEPDILPELKGTSLLEDR